jgi:methionine-gamma-lyase
VYLSTTFTLPDPEEGARRAADVASDEFYGRWGSRNAREFEAIVAQLEGAEEAVAASSGLAVISLLLNAFLTPGSHFVGSMRCYSESRILQQSICDRIDARSVFVDPTDLEEMRQALSRETKVVFVETPANPDITIADIAAVARLVHEQSDALLIIDSTFASPYNQSPLALGADIVMHSATKYIGGHSDVVAGVAAGPAKLLTAVRKVFSFHGPHLEPFAAWLLCRGLKTLGLRMERHNSNALRVAAFLDQRPEVASVRHPFLPSHSHHHVARAQMRGGGGMVAFEVLGGAGAAAALLNDLEIVRMAVSLGSVDSLLAHPASMTHNLLSESEMAEAGISGGMMRLSVGLEDPEDIEADLARGLNRAAAHHALTGAV